MSVDRVLWFDGLRRQDTARVGGKNASLGEMVSQLAARGVRVPNGFATTAAAYREYLAYNNLEERLAKTVDSLATGEVSLQQAGSEIREVVLGGRWPPGLAAEIEQAYARLCRLAGAETIDVAVRSSATAEDLPDASFAGQQESFLNVRGSRALLDACRRCYASLFTDRAISYRQAQGFDHLEVALSVGVQVMVRSDLAGAGVMFSIDTESGFDRVVLIDAAWGLGENVVQGAVDPDAYQVFKPLLEQPAVVPIVDKRCGSKLQKMIYTGDPTRPTRNVPTSKVEQEAYVLDDAEILTLARWACLIEAHYGCPMDMEWAKDGRNGELYIVQARPETVQSRRGAVALESYRIGERGAVLATGLSVGGAVIAAPVMLIESPKDMDRFVNGSVLVTGMTDPDWVPVMKRAAALVTDHGGRTSHAAIVSRELGLPAVVGTGNATRVLRDEQVVTVSCAEGDQGYVYDGTADFHRETLDVEHVPETRIRVMLNLANPEAAYRWWRLPADGVGLARMEFVISNHIRIHPMALVRFDALSNAEARRQIEEMTRGYADRTEYFVDRLARGLSRIAASQFPKPVIVRLSDFKTNEYANLVGGAEFEPVEENPMLGFRGAARYYSPRYRDGFALECRAIDRLRRRLGFTNVVVMIPFCRSITEADRVLETMAANGLECGADGLEVYVMCEVPANVVLAGAFAERFDGFSIGSNDLTQLTLGVDRDSSELSGLFDEEDPAVRWMVRHVIAAAHEAGAPVGLCGQAPSDHPSFAAFLVECGIDSLSVSPDSFLAVKRQVAAAERLAAGHEPDAGRNARD
ncbi:MAG: phosphoenolpyruvate synthase [Pseudomonadales bacterium]